MIALLIYKVGDYSVATKNRSQETNALGLPVWKLTCMYNYSILIKCVVFGKNSKSWNDDNEGGIGALLIKAKAGSKS